MPTPLPVDLLGADLATDPRLRWLRRVLRAFVAYEAAQYVLGGVVALALGVGIWRSSVPHGKGLATQRAVQDGHDLGAILFIGLGALILVSGLLSSLWIVREARQENDGKWG